ncbi:MAG TPA: hypothetical protein VEG68_13755 [Terriglobales bacterium]|nr:hypothetical protein [Terriglobales bacterium]
MNSRLALSALFILIVAGVLASQGTALLEKIKVLPTSWADKISETRSLLVLYRSCTTGNQPRAAGTLAPYAKTMTFNFPYATHCLGSTARHLQHLVLNLIDSDH